MGGCCSSGRAETDRTPVYYYCPRTLEEREPLSSTHRTSSVPSAGLLVSPDLETSIPDTYRPPPSPLPYDVGSACSQAVPRSFENSDVNKTGQMQPADTQLVGEPIGAQLSDTWGDLKESDCKSKTDGRQDSFKVVEDEHSKLTEPVSSAMDDNEDICPTCFEEYDLENPRILTKCEHHFHLSCIFEWMERSDTCPICDQIMDFNCSGKD